MSDKKMTSVEAKCTHIIYTINAMSTQYDALTQVVDKCTFWMLSPGTTSAAFRLPMASCPRGITLSTLALGLLGRSAVGGALSAENLSIKQHMMERHKQYIRIQTYVNDDVQKKNARQNNRD